MKNLFRGGDIDKFNYDPRLNQNFSDAPISTQLLSFQTKKIT